MILFPKFLKFLILLILPILPIVPIFALFAQQQKKGLTRRSDPLLPKWKRLFNCINDCLKCLWLVECKVSQNLTVKSDTLSVHLANKL